MSKLQEAYVILNDERERRAYDIIYPSIPGTQRQTPTSTTQSGVFKEVAQIAVLQKSKRDRDARWEKTSNAFEARILDLMKDIRCLEQGINNLSSIFAAEAVAEAQKNSWTAWILSPISKQVQETEETRVYKDIKRQERRIEKDMKERHLASKKAVLTTEKSRSEKARDEFQATSRSDDSKIQAFRDSISARGIKEMRERERG